MLQRFEDWFEFFGISAEVKRRSQSIIEHAADLSAGMMAPQDFSALAAALLHLRPKAIFDIGTHSGATAEFILRILPKSRVISLDYCPDDDLDAGFSGRPGRLALDQIGAKVSTDSRPRFTQIIGDTGLIVPRDFVARHGAMDFVFIGGEPTAAALAQNTALARKVVADQGAIAWQGANPKRKYLAMRQYLENDLGLNGMATADSYIGGIALWSPALAARVTTIAA